MQNADPRDLNEATEETVHPEFFEADTLDTADGMTYCPSESNQDTEE